VFERDFLMGYYDGLVEAQKPPIGPLENQNQNHHPAILTGAPLPAPPAASRNNSTVKAEKKISRTSRSMSTTTSDDESGAAPAAAAAVRRFD
jgi:hypothetical protein